MTTDGVGPDLRKLARSAERIADSAGLRDIAARLRAHRAERDRPGRRVSMVGEPARGKSTLVNRLVGQDALPTGITASLRVPVVVRATAEGAGEIVVHWPSGTTERRSLAHPQPWHGLAATRWDTTGGSTPPGEDPHVVLSIPSAWLSRTEAEVIDTTGLNDETTDTSPRTQRAVAMSDVVVMAISAQAPLSLAERRFLREKLLTGRTPHVMVAVTGTDAVQDEEVADVVGWIRDQVAALSPDVEVAVAPGPGSPDAAVEALRDRIADLCHGADLVRLRDRRLAWQIIEACGAVRVAAETARGHIQAGEEERRAAVAELKEQIADGDLVWQQLHLDLDERCLRFTRELRTSVKAAASDVFETLDIDLRRTTDLKRWWEHELPYRLRQELDRTTRGLKAQIRDTVARDLRWLDEEVTRRFGREHRSPVEVGQMPFAGGEPDEITLDDVRTRRTITRVITVAGGLVGAAIAAVSGIGAPAALTIGGSVGATLLAERDAERRLDEQRDSLRRHLRRMLDEAVAGFDSRLPGEAAAAYRAAFEELRTAQAAWRTACLEALAQSDDPGVDITMWTDVVGRIDAVAREISTDEGDGSEAAAGYRLPHDTDLDGTDQEGEDR